MENKEGYKVWFGPAAIAGLGILLYLIENYGK